MPKAPEVEPPQDEASVSDALQWALGYLALATAACWVLQQSLARGLVTLSGAGFGKQGEWQGAVQPFAAGLRTQLELVLGPLARLPVGLDTVVGVAALMALLAIGRSLVRANELSARALAQAAKAAKAAKGE